MKNAFDFGFSPGNDAQTNTKALQNAVNGGGEIIVNTPGVYDIDDTIVLSDDTSLEFAPDVTVRRQRCSGFQGNAFINRGAFTGEYNSNISIKGLHLSVNGIESTPASIECSKTIAGLRGHLAFLYIKNLHLDGIVINDLEPKDYAIQVSDFEHVIIENLHIEGLKDGVHFGPGRDFILRNSDFRTYDDPIALNCSDYAVSNPNLGSIEDGLIENCRDLSAEETTGLFLRILTGGWTDWRPGMIVRHSDAVVRNNRIYRVVMQPSEKEYVSDTPPEHENGFAVLDGITWVRTNLGNNASNIPYLATCRNITLKNISLEKNRDIAMLIYFDDSEYLHSYRQGAPVPVVEGLKLINVKVNAKIDHLLSVWAPTKDIIITDCEPNGSDISVEHRFKVDYPITEFTVRDTKGLHINSTLGAVKML